MAVNSQGKVIKIKTLVMTCGKCLKDKDKLWWFNSDSTFWDNALYCKECKWFPALTKDGKKTDTSKLHTRL